ncbi:hypothetical protein MMPV_004777 [Pyropia vietnamensis]
MSSAPAPQPPVSAQYEPNYAFQTLTCAATATATTISHGESNAHAAGLQTPSHDIPIHQGSAALPQQPQPVINDEAAATQDRVMAWLNAATTANTGSAVVASTGASNPGVPAIPTFLSTTTPAGVMETALVPYTAFNDPADDISEYNSDSDQSSVSVASLVPDPTARLYRTGHATVNVNSPPVDGQVEPVVHHETGPRYRDGGGFLANMPPHLRPIRPAHEAPVMDPEFQTPEQRYHNLTGSWPRWGPLGRPQ